MYEIGFIAHEISGGAYEMVFDHTNFVRPNGYFVQKVRVGLVLKCRVPILAGERISGVWWGGFSRHQEKASSAYQKKGQFDLSNRKGKKEAKRVGLLLPNKT